MNNDIKATTAVEVQFDATYLLLVFLARAIQGRNPEEQMLYVAHQLEENRLRVEDAAAVLVAHPELLRQFRPLTREALASAAPVEPAGPGGSEPAQGAVSLPAGPAPVELVVAAIPTVEIPLGVESGPLG